MSTDTTSIKHYKAMKQMKSISLPDKEQVCDRILEMIDSGRLTAHQISAEIRETCGMIIKPYNIYDNLRRRKIGFERLDMIARICSRHGMRYKPLPDPTAMLHELNRRLQSKHITIYQLEQECIYLGFPSSDRRDIRKALFKSGYRRINRLITAYNNIIARP